MQVKTANDNELLVGVLPEQPLLQLEEELTINPQVPKEMEQMCLDLNLSPPHLSDAVALEGDLDEAAVETVEQFDNAVQEQKEVAAGDRLITTYGDAVCLICQQKPYDRCMVCCSSCQGWFHGDCVGDMKKEDTEFICLVCITKEQNQLLADLTIHPELGICPLKSLIQSPPTEHSEDVENEQTQSTLEMMEVDVNPLLTVETEPATVSQTSSPICIGPDCDKAALPGSVYCGSDCIMQHAAATIKNLSVPKAPKAKGRGQRKAAPAKTLKGSRASKRLADRSEAVEQTEEEDGQESESSQTCDPSLTEAQATHCNASADEGPGVATDVTETVTVTEQVLEDSAPPTPVIPTTTLSPAPAPEEIAPSPEPIPEPALQKNSPEKTKEPVTSNVSTHSSKKSDPSNAIAAPVTPPKSTHNTQTTPKASKSAEAQIINRLHETGAIVAKKTSFVIPKKASPAPQSHPDQASSSASPSGPPPQRPSSGNVAQGETRNLPVPPAPSAPSSRPSQPNTQVRHSIQRSLVGILYKRVCDSDGLDMSENDVGKLVTNIETEMFNIFRNTDSKYMNKYRTIMFNLKDPKNKGLLHRLVQGEISPFRLVRMSQKDMQAIQPPEPSPTEIKGGTSVQKPEPVKLDLPSLIQKRTDKTKEQKKALAPFGGSSVQNHEPVKLDLPTLIQTRTEKNKNMPSREPKKTLSDPILKSKSSQRASTVPDILTCMLKDTTAEHHKHLFDVKCKICTGQMSQDETEEPAQKKKRVSEDKPSWRSFRGDDSPLQAPPDSPELDSPVPHFSMGSPVLTIVEPPTSPTTENSPSPPPIDTPASPVMESPASPTSDDAQSAQMKTYMPVVIPAVSTVTITRRDPRTAASRYAALTNSSAALTEREPQKSDAHFLSSALPTAPPVSLPAMPILPKSILLKPTHSADPRLYGSSSRNLSPKLPSEGGTAQFLSKQDIVWKGFLNMLTIAKFVTKGYLVSGPAEPLKADLPDTIQIGGRILPKTVWDYVAKLKTSVTKELCIIRFQPATDEEEVAYVSLFSYFSSRGRFGVVGNNNRSIKDMYLFPLSANEAVPAILQPLEGPGFEKKRPNLLLGLAIIQKTKRPGSLSVEVEEKRPKVSISADPSWIPKPPSLYGSNESDDLKPYDPETPIRVTPPGSPPISTPAPSVSVASASQSKSKKENIPTKTDTTKSNNDSPLQTILKQLFPNKQNESSMSSEESSTTKVTSSTKCPVSMVDPIVQQYGGKITIEEIEEDDNDLDRPYDPEDEYDPAGGYGKGSNKSNIGDVPAFSEEIHDDIAYDPEDETIFQDIQNDSISKNISDTVQTSKSVQPPVQNSSFETPPPASTPNQITIPATATYTFPTGTVVISAETLTEQQRMLEELNRQIEEQKRQLKEQEEALRQQREAVGMFMAQFSASDSLVSPASTALPLNKLVTVQRGVAESVKDSPPECPVVETTSATSEKDAPASALLDDKSETQEPPIENEQNSSAGEVGDSDVAYDPEDESLFDEIQSGMLEKKRSNSRDSSVSKKEQSSGIGRRHKHSPKRRSHRERGRHQSPQSKSQRRSPSRSRRRRDRDRQHRSERNSSRHRSRDRSERRSRTQRDSTSYNRSHRHRRSSSSHRNKHSAPHSPHRKRELSGERQVDAKTKNSDDRPLISIPNETSISSDNVNAAENELPVSLEVKEEPACNDNLPGDLKRLKWAAELMLDGKLDSLIPLRELEPPTRDSPQSPDPEPKLDLIDFTAKKIKNEPEINKCEENVETENSSKPLQMALKCVLNDKNELGLMEEPASACIKTELIEEAFSENFVSKQLNVIESLTKNKRSCDGSAAFEESEKEKQPMRHGSPEFEKPARDNISLDRESSIGQSDQDRQKWSSSLPIHKSEHISTKAIEHETSGTKQIHSQQIKRHQVPEEDHSENRARKESENIGSKYGEGERLGPEIRNRTIETGIFSEGQNVSGSLHDMKSGSTNSRDEGIQRRDSFPESDRSGFEGPICSSQSTDHPQPKMRRGNFENFWNNNGRAMPFGGPGSRGGRHEGPPFGGGERLTPVDRPVEPPRGEFGETGLGRGGPMVCSGTNRGGFGGPGFGRGGPVDIPDPHREGFRGQNFNRSGECLGGPVDFPGPHRGGFVGPAFGRGEEHTGGPIENPGHYRGALEQEGFDRVSMEGSGACGGTGFDRVREQDTPGFGREGPVDGPRPHRGGFGRGGEYRGPVDCPGSSRGGFGGQRGGEQGGSTMEGQGPHRGGFGQTFFNSGGEHRCPMDDPGPNRDGLGRHAAHRSQMDSSEYQRRVNDGPKHCTGPHRGGFGGPGFGRGREHHRGGHEDSGFDNSMSGPRSHRGGFEGPGFGGSSEHRGAQVENQEHHRGSHEEPEFDRGGQIDGPVPHRGRRGIQRGGPMDSSVPHRGRFRGACFGRGGEHRGPIDCSEHQMNVDVNLEFDCVDPMDGPGPHRGGFRERSFDCGGESRGPLDCPENQISRHDESGFDRGPVDGPGPFRGGFGRPCFGRGSEHGGQMDGQGPERGAFRGRRFSRGGEPRGGFRGQGFGRGDHEEPDFNRPHRGSFGGPIIGRGRGHRTGSMEGQGSHEGEFGEPDCERSDENQDFYDLNFDRAGPMDEPGPHRGGFGRPGFGRGGENRGGLIKPPGPRRESCGEPDFDRGWELGDGPHCGGPRRAGFGRGHEHGSAPMDGPGPHRGGFRGPRGHRGGPVFGRDENRGGPMTGPGKFRGFGEPELNRTEDNEQRGGPMNCLRPFRTENERIGFDRDDSGRSEGPDFRERNDQEGPRQQRSEAWTPGFRRCEQGDFPMDGPNEGPNFRGPGPNLRGPFRDGPVANNRQGIVRNDPEEWNTGPQSHPRGLGPSRDNCQKYSRTGPGGPEFIPDGGPGPNRRGLQNECMDSSNREFGQTDRPFGGPRGMVDYRPTKSDNQRSGCLRPENKWNEENRYRYDEGPDKPRHIRERLSQEREGSHGRDMRDDQARPFHRKQSPSRECPPQRKDHEIDSHSDLPTVDSMDHKHDVHSPHRIEPHMKSQPPGESVPEQSIPAKRYPKPEEPQVMPRRVKPALLPTPPKGPTHPLFSPQGQGRARGGPRR